jgi:3-methyladenine DNA glycosylase/8-oxoguanine DNA glycosylase
MTAPVQRRWRPAWPVDLTATLGPLRHGRADPTLRIGPDGLWRTTRTPDGPATIRYAVSDGHVLATAWGPGADRELESMPTLLGADDDPTGFAAQAHPVMAAAHRRHGDRWRVPRTTRTLEALVPAVLEQRVTGLEASRAWRRLVTQFGERAPGPHADLRVPPDGHGWAAIPSWAWHRAGVDPGRAGTIAAAARRATSLERLAGRPPQEATAALTSLPGVGQWTAAEVAVRAWGDIDAVSFGDYHLAGFVVHALTGRRDGTDGQMADLLVPWTGQRARAIRLLELHCPTMPRRAPRATITDHRRR